MAGSKTGWSEPVLEKISPTLNPPSRSSDRKSIAITTDRFIPPPRRFLIFVFKELSRRSDLSSENSRSSPPTNHQRISSASGWIEW
jgi:hypothetical protein